MREILFRGKRVFDGKWSYSAYPKGEMHSDAMVYDYDPKTVCQYTGLEDRNGKKIFEGDIIRKLVPVYKTGQKDPVGDRWMIGSVFWDDSDSQFPGYWAISAQDEHGNNEKYIFTCKFEVIGNIYDNPELLEVEE